MNLLLDTHTLLWALQAPQRLRAATRDQLIDPTNTVIASVVSIWEISIKRSLGKLDAPDNLAGALDATGIDALAITVEHAERVAALPLHHRDPFDRLLVAQAMVEGLTLVTRDRHISAYDIPTLAA